MPRVASANERHHLGLENRFPLALGKRMSSVDERNDLRVSESVSERNELLRRFICAYPSAKVAALANGRRLRS